MDSKKINALITVSECGSITSAARKLGYTQPGLTNMMNALEAELGLTLLVRSKGGVTLSRDGWELLPSMKRMLEADEELTRYAARLVEKNKTTLRVGAFSSAARHWLPNILEQFRASDVGTDAAVSATDIAATYEAVKSGALDCAIVSRQVSLMSGLGWVSLKKDELVAVLPADYITDENSFPVALFDEEIFLMPAGGFELDIIPALTVNGHKLEANIRYTNLDDAAIASMVSHRFGFSILSRLVMQGIHEDVRTLSLSPRAFREMGIILREDRFHEKNIARFLEVAKAVVENMSLEEA